MAAFLNVCRFNPTAGGTTDWTYSTAVTGYQSPTAAGVVNGTVYRYRAESSDLTQWEIGYGSYNTGTGVLARTAVLFNSLGTTAKINFSAAPQVAIVALAEDMPSLTAPNTFTDTTEATGAGTTASAIFSGGLEILKKLFVTGIAAFTNSTASTSTTTGAVVVTGGLGVGGAGWFGGAIRTAANFIGTGAPGSYASIDFSSTAAVSVAGALASNTAITPTAAGAAVGLISVYDATHGYGAVYFLNAGSVSTVVLSGPWVATTTTPAADKISIAWNGTAYGAYNNYAASVNVRAGFIRI